VRLDVCSSASSSDRQLATTLTFSYYPQLKLVGVLAGSSEDQELITNLFLGDVGDGLMLENVAVCGSSAGAPLQFAEAGRPCPFRYEQQTFGKADRGWGERSASAHVHVSLLPCQLVAVLL
jgi:hypothetical protein